MVLVVANKHNRSKKLTQWLKENGETVGVDTGRIGIGGPSAGGGMAAALALLVRDRGEFEIDYQLLIYPMIDDTRTTITANWDVPVWAPESNHYGWSSYLGELFESAAVPAHAAPARESNLEGLPPTFIMVGTLDAFADGNLDNLLGATLIDRERNLDPSREQSVGRHVAGALEAAIIAINGQVTEPLDQAFNLGLTHRT